MDRVEYSIRRRHGDRRHVAVWIREGFPAACLSDRTYRSRKMVLRKRHRTRQGANERLGGEPGAHRKVMDSILAPYRVLDLTDESGFLCGKILADLGADVIKIEAPGGDAARMLGPFPGDKPDRNKSLYWIAYNVGKLGITLNLESARGRELLRKLALRADFLIETFPPGWLDRHDLGFETLRKLNPRIIVVSITPFGQTGPYSSYKGSDLVAMAMSGLMSLIGEPGETPLRVSFPQSPMWSG